ncbi:MAG: hypothetical protein QHG99_06740 [Methanomicrobiales archaeon]|nr:hypothetical protein [Methanomicrobiales archaeon]
MKPVKIVILLLFVILGFFISWIATGDHIFGESTIDPCADIEETTSNTAYDQIEYHADQAEEETGTKIGENQDIQENPYSDAPLSYGFIGMNGAPAAPGAGGAGAASAAGPSGTLPGASQCPAGTTGEICSTPIEEVRTQIGEDNSPPTTENGVNEGSGDETPGEMLVPEFPIIATPAIAIIGLLFIMVVFHRQQ